MTIAERIALALERTDKSQRDLAKFMGLAAPTVNAMLAKDDIDSIRYLKAVEELTGYRFEWLRTGIGPEKLDEQANEEQLPDAFVMDIVKTKNELIEELKGRIGDMKKYIEVLENQIKDEKKTK